MDLVSIAGRVIAAVASQREGLDIGNDRPGKSIIEGPLLADSRQLPHYKARTWRADVCSRHRNAVAHRVRAMARAWMPELRQRRSSCLMVRCSIRSPVRQAGCRFLLGTSLLLRASCPAPFGPTSPFAHVPACTWASKREVPRAPQAHESSFALNQENRLAQGYEATRNTSFPR